MHPPTHRVLFQDNFQNTYLGGILIAVAFLNAFIEFYQLQKSEAILASFLAMIPPSCRAVRDGQIITIPAASLVKGDLVLIVRRRPPWCRMLTYIQYCYFVAYWRQDSSRSNYLLSDESES